MRISLAAILVEDQDNASRFYSEILGFRVETDAVYGSGPVQPGDHYPAEKIWKTVRWS